MGDVFSVVLDVTLKMEEILEEEISNSGTIRKRKAEDEDTNLGNMNSDLKEDFASSEKRIRTEISNIDSKLIDLDATLNGEVSNSENRVKSEMHKIKAKLCEIEVKLEEEVFNSEERVKTEISRMEERLQKKILEVKKSNQITGPECPVCFHELRPPLKVVQCQAGHKVGSEVVLSLMIISGFHVRSVSLAARAIGVLVRQSLCALEVVSRNTLIRIG